MSRSKKFNTKYSPEFKVSVIIDMCEHGLSYHETVRKYWGVSTRREIDSKAKPSDCFIAGTKILTEHGKKNIEDIKVGDKVWSWNETTKKQELKPVVQLFRNNKRDMVYISVGGEKITTTTEHPFYVKGSGWVRAKNLLDTDSLVCYNGDVLKIDRVQIEYAETAVQTYNFEVEGNHNYYVGEASVLAHNMCKVAELSDNQLRNFGSKGKTSGFRQVSGSHDDAMRFVQSQTDGLTEFAPGKFVGKNSRGVEFRIFAKPRNNYTSIRINGVTGLKGIKFMW